MLIDLDIFLNILYIWQKILVTNHIIVTYIRFQILIF